MPGQKRRFVGVMNARNRPKAKTADDVYAHLFDAIVDQRLLPGTKLTELALMEAFGVGRRIVGVALQRLVWENLVVSFPNRGAFVAAPDAAEVRQSSPRASRSRRALQRLSRERRTRRRSRSFGKISKRSRSCAVRGGFGRQSTSPADFTC